MRVADQGYAYSALIASSGRSDIRVDTAGSPVVIAMRGAPLILRAFVEPVLDIGLVAQLPHPVLVRLIGFAIAQRLTRLQPRAIR